MKTCIKKSNNLEKESSGIAGREHIEPCSENTQHLSRGVGVLLREHLSPLKHIHEDHKTNKTCPQMTQNGVSLNLMAVTSSLRHSERYYVLTCQAV